MLEVKLGQKRGTINRKKCNFQILENCQHGLPACTIWPKIPTLGPCNLTKTAQIHVKLILNPDISQ